METITFFIMMGFCAAVLIWYIHNDENGESGTLGFIGIIFDKLDGQINAASKGSSPKMRVRSKKENTIRNFKNRRNRKKGLKAKNSNPHQIQKVKLDYDKGAQNQLNIKRQRISEKQNHIELQTGKARPGLSFDTDAAGMRSPANDTGLGQRPIERKSYKAASSKRFKMKSGHTGTGRVTPVRPRETLAEIPARKPVQRSSEKLNQKPDTDKAERGRVISPRGKTRGKIER